MADFANAAAYQKFDQYRTDQVEQMISWLENFTGRIPEPNPLSSRDSNS